MAKVSKETRKQRSRDAVEARTGTRKPTGAEIRLRSTSAKLRMIADHVGTTGLPSLVARHHGQDVYVRKNNAGRWVFLTMTERGTFVWAAESNYYGLMTAIRDAMPSAEIITATEQDAFTPTEFAAATDAIMHPEQEVM